VNPERQYDVFISYSPSDADTVATVAEALRMVGLRVWFDRWSLVPGAAWQRSVDEAITKARSIAVFIGTSGVSSWQQDEVQRVLQNSITGRRSSRVIPVMLPGAEPQLLPALVHAVAWIDMRKGISDNIALGRLVTAIEGLPETSENAQEQEISESLRVASAERKMGNYSSALSHLKRALDIQLTTGSETGQLSTIYNNLGSVLREQGQLAEAMQYFERALALDEKASGSDSQAVANRLNNLGTVLRDQGRLDEAAAYFRRALAIDETALGSDNLTVANRLSNLGSVLRDQGRLEEAVALFRRALAIDEKALGPDHPTVANLLSNLGGALRDQGRLEEAVALFRRALAIDEKALGPDHPTVANLLSNLGGALRDQGRLEEAVALFQRALEIDEKALGPDHPTVANRLNNLGSVVRDQGRLEEAVAFFRRALEIDEKALGPDHPSSATVLNNLAGVYAQRVSGDHDANLREAIRLLERARASFERVGSAFQTGQTLANLGMAYSRLSGGDRLGNVRTALDYCDEALRVLQEIGISGESNTIREVQRIRKSLLASLA
jgi:tetratricopeptide (TPR) repeat protein